jgi:hypothetical protein
MARADIGKTDLSDISLLKSEIFAIVFRCLGESEIAAEGGVPASVRPGGKAAGFFIPNARNPLKSPDSKK